jgi:hypothetical protein
MKERRRCEDGSIARSSRGLHFGDGGDELVPRPDLVRGGRVGDAGLVEQALVDVEADGGEVGEEGRDGALLVLGEEVLHDAALGGDVGEVL